MELIEPGYLVVNDFGAVLRKKRRRVLVSSKEGKREIPVKNILQVIITGKVMLTSDLISFLADSGIDILFATPTGKPKAIVVASKLGGTAENRREQYRAVEDERGFLIAKTLIAGKIKNQFSNLRYYSKARRASEEISSKLFDAYEELKSYISQLDALEYSNEWREGVMSIEARAASVYWQSLALFLREFGFYGREQDGNDVVNILLNVSYNMLSSQIWRSCLQFGLDPFCGFLHTERPGKLSLVFDMMEPYRPMVDRFVISFLRHAESLNVNECISKIIKEFFSRFLNQKIEYKGRKMRIATTMFYFTQEIVSFLRGNKEFISTPFISY